MVKPGSPFETWTSTETAHPSAPLSVAELIAANMPDERSVVGAGALSGIFPRFVDDTERPTSRVGAYVRIEVSPLGVYAQSTPAYTPERESFFAA